ncbi:nucleoid-structuring protein H-NS [bacterium E08(2017)]|nr:nucleoid-structuring protein H-NS [bacterium E08(2017)]
MTENTDAANGGWVAYRPEIKVLDCTIRDGGLTNDHNFHDEMVKKIYDVLVAAGVDYMELGYKSSQRIYAKDNFGDWKFCEEESIRRIVEDNPSDLKLSVMADAERCDYKTDILPRDDSVIDLIRVACYIHQIPLAMDMIKDATDKGYETFLQLMATSTIAEKELAKALEIAAKSDATAVYIVDSFGSLYSENIRDLTQFFMKALEGSGKEVGFHGHNNMQLAFANTIEAIVNGANRLDATISGIGRGAGNCPLELLMGFLHNPKFKIRPVLDACQNVFVPLSKEIDWGYSIPYALTGQMNQHPREAIAWRSGDNPDDYLGFYDKLREED